LLSFSNSAFQRTSQYQARRPERRPEFIEGLVEGANSFVSVAG